MAAPVSRGIGQPCRCPKCGKLLVIAHLPPTAWVECVCKSCKRAVLFPAGGDPIIMPRHGQPEETP